MLPKLLLVTVSRVTFVEQDLILQSRLSVLLDTTALLVQLVLQHAQQEPIMRELEHPRLVIARLAQKVHTVPILPCPSSQKDLQMMELLELTTKELRVLIVMLEHLQVQLALLGVSHMMMDLEVVFFLESIAMEELIQSTLHALKAITAQEDGIHHLKLSWVTTVMSRA